MKDLRIVRAEELKGNEDKIITQCSKVMVDAFEKEGINQYLFDFSKKRTKRILSRILAFDIKMFLDSNDVILLALHEKEIVGLAILKKDPTKKEPFKQKLGNTFGKIFLGVPLLFSINFRRLISIKEAFKLSQGIKDNYYTLQAIAVQPSYQGKGIGKKLLNSLHEINEDSSSNISGIYLYTADEKNRLLYERYNYQTIEKYERGKIKVYHMFRKKCLL